MDVKEYMERDFELLQKRVADVSKAYEHQDPGKTMDQAREMFEAFSRRFALEDFLLAKSGLLKVSQPTMAKFLAGRREVREKLEDLLMLHVSEPDFLEGIGWLLRKSNEHIEFLKTEFYPEVLGKLTQDDWNYMANSLEDRLHQISF